MLQLRFWAAMTRMAHLFYLTVPNNAAPRNTGFRVPVDSARDIEVVGVRSAVLRRRTGLPPSTGETDAEHAYDT
jgi:hypothetical protein